MGGKTFGVEARRLDSSQHAALFKYVQTQLDPFTPFGLRTTRSPADKTTHGDLDVMIGSHANGPGFKYQFAGEASEYANLPETDFGKWCSMASTAEHQWTEQELESTQSLYPLIHPRIVEAVFHAAKRAPHVIGKVRYVGPAPRPCQEYGESAVTSLMQVDLVQSSRRMYHICRPESNKDSKHLATPAAEAKGSVMVDNHAQRAVQRGPPANICRMCRTHLQSARTRAVEGQKPSPPRL